MNRRSFFKGLGAVIAAASAPTLFIPSAPTGWKLKKSGLLTYDYDIRKILLEHAIKDITTEIDAKFIELTERVIRDGIIEMPTPRPSVAHAPRNFDKIMFPVFTQITTS